jgi:CubicO group peptidase (beta-lactamase class C family)
MDFYRFEWKRLFFAANYAGETFLTLLRRCARMETYYLDICGKIEGSYQLLALTIFISLGGDFMSKSAVLPRSVPEIQGVASSAVLNFLHAVEKSNLELHSFMFLRHGFVIAEGWWSPYESQHPHMLFSLSKSFASTAIGLAVDEGRLSVDDLVISFFPEEVTTEIAENMGTIRVRHLLTMSTGNPERTMDMYYHHPDGNWVKGFLNTPISYPPGTHFVYDSGTSYMLSAIIHKLTGSSLLDYLKPRLFEPLGIQDPKWETCPKGINTGGWGLSIKTEDITKFGQLYLQNGVWNGKRIIPQDWVEEATSFHISTETSQNDIDKQQGYGYQFWRCTHGAYTGRGAHGQFCLVLPEQDAVIAFTSGLSNMQDVLNHVWEYLFPAMEVEALPENTQAQAALVRKLAALSLPVLQQHEDSSPKSDISGKTYVLEENEQSLESVSLKFEVNRAICTIGNRFGVHKIHSQNAKWLKSETALLGNSMIVASQFTWRDENTLALQVCFVETPFVKRSFFIGTGTRSIWNPSVM